MKSNKTKYLILLLIGISLLNGFIIYFVYQNYKKDTLLETENNLIERSQNYSVFMQNTVDPLKAIVKNTGILLSDFHFNNPNEMKSIFDETINEVPLISSMYFVSEKDGSQITDNKNVSNKVDLRDRSWYVNTTLSENPTITPVYTDMTSQKPVITLTYAIRRNGDLKGVIAADIFLEDIYITFGIITHTENVDHYIVDVNGNIILHPEHKLLGFSMFNPKKSYLDQFSGDTKKMMRDLIKIWDENKENLLKSPSGQIYYSNALKEKTYGYFNKIPHTNWIIVSRINYEKVKINNFIYLMKVSIFGFVILIGLGIFIYFVFTKIYNLDDLTGIYGRNKLLQVLKKEPKSGGKIILFIDMYNFSTINGNYGSKVGNEVIKELTDILKNYLYNDGLLTHSKADHFIFLFNTEDWDKALQKTEELNEKLKDLAVKIDNLNININAFLGLTKLNSLEMEDLDTSILLIEDILNYLKKTNKKNFLVFPDSHDLIEIKKQINNKKEELIKAMEEDRIVPFFQPIYDIKENKIEKFEVLMRIKNGENYLSPFPYIKVAEENNLIGKLDLMVIQKALKYKSEVDPKDTIKLSVNVSGRGLNDVKFLPKIVLLIEQYKIKYKNIIFEITETQNIEDLDRLINTIHTFRELGFEFSIDDFGTGFSSMQYLKRIPAAYLKIDGSFITDLNENQENFYLVKSIVSMARAFKMIVIAEYVENEKILNTLKEIGVDYAQGYYIGKPNKSFIITK
ncbi:EAL domain-containing protein [Tepidibacter sp. Z1-5]|uniref:EAL domain-containing protein n=1 Tax=Tepidibacter sp. Z1-5 TaxID=3134138 RepID=UPI0030C52F3F